MADPHCIVLAQSLAKPVATTWLCGFSPNKETGWFSLDLIAPMIAFAGGLAGLLLNGWLQRKVDQRNRDQAEMTARGIAYAELWRIWRETSFAVDFVARDASFEGGMIWIPVYRSIYPRKDNLDRIAPLTAKEVNAVTSVYYVYQESMVFIKAAALGVLPLLEQHGAGELKRRAPFFSLDEDAIEYVYKIDGSPHFGRREEVLKWLRIVEGQAQKALVEIESAAKSHFPRSDLAVLIQAKKKDAAASD